MRTTPAARLAGLLLAAALAGACATGGDGPDAGGAAAAPAGATAGAGATTTTTTAGASAEGPRPGEAWTRIAAAEAGLDQAALEEVAAAAERGGSECLVVTKDGQVVGEWYWQGFGPETEREVFSVTKSITSTLVGIAQDRGLLDIDDAASTYIDEWRGTTSDGITIRNLLSNDSGRFQDFATDYIEMAAQAPDKTAFSIGLAQQHAPGTEWVYNNAAIQTLEAVLEEATGQPVGEFAHEALFEPLGMGTTISTDAAGNTLTFMGAQASCLDLARFGLLFLRNGSWDGEQIVSEAWVAQATSPSQDLNPGYGYLWWLDRAAGTYAALGLHGQVVAVHPGDGLVATRLGADKGADGSGFGLGELAAGLTRALGREPAEDDVTVG